MPSKRKGVPDYVPVRGLLADLNACLGTLHTSRAITPQGRDVRRNAAALLSSPRQFSCVDTTAERARSRFFPRFHLRPL